MPAKKTSDLAARRTLIFCVLAASYMLVTFHRLCPAVVASDMMRDLNTGGGLLGMLSGAYFYSYGLMQVPAGLLADSWGARRATSVFYLLAAIGAVCMGMAAGPGWATAGRILVGVGLSMIWACSLKTLAEWYPPARFVSMTGLLLALGGVGSLLASAPLAWTASAVGWRTSFVILGALSAVFSLVLWLVVRDTPAKAGYDTLSATPSPKPQEKKTLLPGIRQVIGSPWIWLMAAWFFLDNGILFSLAGLWAGPYLKHVYAMGPNESGMILAMFSIGMITGAPFISVLSTRWLKSRKKALTVNAVVLLGCMALLVWRTAEMSRLEMYALFYFIGVSSGTTPVIAFTMVKELFPVSLAGTAVGVANIFPFIGGAIYQPVLGVILENAGRDAAGNFIIQGYRDAFWFLTATAVLLLLLCLTLKETYRPEEEHLHRKQRA